jgi:hypothetical protein
MPYVLFSESVEVLQENEQDLIEQITASVLRTNRVRLDKHQHAKREAHAKSHGLLAGTLIVNDDLPPHLRQGLFVERTNYPVIARLSSAPGDIQSDRIPTPRGLALKVLGVPGPMLDEVPSSVPNQDWLLVNAPAIPFGDVTSYAKVQKLIENRADTAEILKLVAAKAARGANLVLGMVGLQSEILGDLGPPNNHILGETFHSMAAVRFGKFIAKISVAPLSPNVKALQGKTVEVDDEHPCALRDLVAEFFRQNSAEYEVRAQLCTDLEKMPVEDASVVWDEELSPHLPIARIVFSNQATDSPARRVFGDDLLSFTPWRAMAAHRPLGSIMRVRRPVYEASSRFRHEMNARPAVEPQQLSEVLD